MHSITQNNAPKKWRVAVAQGMSEKGGRGMNNKPQFITFTGADDKTDPSAMAELSAKYPIEWGILFSPKRQGTGRYPSVQAIRQMVCGFDLAYSAHLCGGDARAVIERGASQYDDLICEYFMRSQINTADTTVNPTHIENWGDGLHIGAILQCRGAFPDNASVAWLFDASGGRGIEPKAWPAPIDGVLCGYAGGLRPSNVADAVAKIGATTDRYWIDMETGVRDENDVFSLDLCRQVCEAVYGDAA